MAYRNEIYSGLFGQEWPSKASRFGIFAGSNQIAIQVILADDYTASLRHIVYAKSLFRDGKFTAEQFAAATSPQSLTASIGYHEMHISAVEIVFRNQRDK